MTNLSGISGNSPIDNSYSSQSFQVTGNEEKENQGKKANPPGQNKIDLDDLLETNEELKKLYDKMVADGSEYPPEVLDITYRLIALISKFAQTYGSVITALSELMTLKTNEQQAITELEKQLKPVTNGMGYADDPKGDNVEDKDKQDAREKRADVNQIIMNARELVRALGDVTEGDLKELASIIQRLQQEMERLQDLAVSTLDTQARISAAVNK